MKGQVIRMNKKNVINLIRAHVEKNEKSFKEAAYNIADELDVKGDNELAEYIMALLYDSNIFYTHDVDYRSNP